MVCFRLKRHVLNCFIFSDYDSLRDVGKKKKTDRIVNIDKEKYVYSCKEIFVVRLSKNQYKSTVHSQFL